MSEEILTAIKLLDKNGYIVIKMTAQMNADVDECERMSEEGQSKDCEECSCNRCLIQ